ncbi:hypothetical protein CspHIS471_0500890 [Cutaneotrichosporon sp. HIS471]|nr:hypothetical protein CspHIS471_0500890 [Cutaneotrichosporon sp. HIS471]
MLPTYPPKPSSPPPVIEEDSEDANSEHEHDQPAPLPDFSKRGPRRRASSSSANQGTVSGGRLRSGSSSSTKGPVPPPKPRSSFSSGVAGPSNLGMRSRQRAFSAGAGAGSVITRGGSAPTSEPLPIHKDGVTVFEGVEVVNRNNGFSDLTRNMSQMSQSSNRTFADAAFLMNMPDLSREQTRTERRARARSGTVTTMASLRRYASVFSEGIVEDDETDDKEDVEELVGVQVTDDGEEIVYPDGGLQAWLVLAGGFCAAICAFGLAGSVGAFQTYYAQHMLKGYSSSTISWIGSTQAAVCFSSCLFTGPLFDRYGCRPLLAGGAFLLFLAFIILSFCKEYYQIFLVHATLMAMGMDFMFIVPMGAVGQWFFLRRGLAFGILMMGSSAGAIIWPAIVANLPQRIGFAWTCRLIALIIAFLGATCTLLVKTRLPPRPPGPFFNFAEFRNPAYAFVALSFPFYVFGFFSFLTFIGTYGSLAGLGPLAPYLLMITNGASAFGRLAAGIGADMFGTFNVAIAGIVAMAILSFAWLAMDSAGPLIALCCLYGFASGAPVSLQGPMVTVSATDPRQAGTLIGQALMVQSIAQLTGPPIFGAIVGAGSPAEQLSRFPHAIIFGSCMLLVAGCLVTGARMCRTRELFAII